MTRVLDHVGVAFRNLDDGQALFEKLGFTLTPRSLHYGTHSPDEPVTLWGSGNHLAVFHEGFVEAIGVTDPNGPSRVNQMVAKHAGAHIVALGGEPAAAQYEDLRRFGDLSTGVCSLQRKAPFGPNNEELRHVEFHNVYINESLFPEAHFLLIEHITPEVIWQPHHLQHANGSVALRSVYFATPDPAALADKLRPLFHDQARRADDAVELPLDRGNAWLFTPEAWRARAPGQYVPPLPAPVGYAIAVEDLDTTRAYLKERGFGWREGLNLDSPLSLDRVPGIWVSADEAGGAAIHFIQNDRD